MKTAQILEKLRTGFEVAENITFGLDIGIASCGWSILDVECKNMMAAGTWGFEVPEVAKTRESKAAVRRTARGQRRRLRRRRQRVRDIRQLLFENNLLSSATAPKDEKGKSKPAINPWDMRAEGLERLLKGDEMAFALIHIAKHRGYRSNSKSEKSSNAPPEDKKVLAGLASIEEKSARYRTVGKMFADDAEFADKKRNRSGDYSYTVLRSLHEDEIRILFDAQRKLGSSFANPQMQEHYARLAFDQLPLQDSEHLLGTCPFENQEKRASSLAYSFEKFRFLSKLNTVRIQDDTKSGRRLNKQELSLAVSGFGKNSAKITWKALCKLTGLPASTAFIGVGDANKSKDIARNSKGCAYGSNTLYKTIGEAAWNSLVQTPQVLDAIAHVLTFREDVGQIEAGLQELALEPSIFKAIMSGVEAGVFAGFSKAGHISTKAARNILPGLLSAQVYSEACELAGYDHAKENPADLETMTNPVAKRAIYETIKQVNALVRQIGWRPGAIHIELGRDVGKGPEERGKILKGIERRTADKAKARSAFSELVNQPECSFGELQRYELWKEQKHNCMFCDVYIGPEDLCDGKHICEIEHILPLSRSHDNSWHNKALACIKCNRDKAKRTPYEWFGDIDERWDAFEFRVKSLHTDKRIKGFKIRNLLIRDYDEREQGFIERNKNDMRYAARVIKSELHHLYNEAENTGRKRLFARPGQITAILRRLWGLDRFKYLPSDKGKKERIEDERHHGVDAMVVAACTESLLQRLTRAMQVQEEKGLPALRLSDFKPPWPDFPEQVREIREKAPVARSENRRARGAGHAATIRQIRDEEGRRITYERTNVAKLSKAALERIKDPERNCEVIAVLTEWVAAGMPEDNPPKRSNGDVIRKVTLRSEKNPITERTGFEAHGGLVDNADMVRVDVFEKEKKFFLVPIYAHQVANRKQWPEPPKKAISSGKIEAGWTDIDTSHIFRFSLYPFSWVEVVKRDGEILEGYYRGADRSTGAITLSHERSRQNLIRSIGARTLSSFKKHQVDRLGKKSEIKQEVRTWHGVACT